MKRIKALDKENPRIMCRDCEDQSMIPSFPSDRWVQRDGKMRPVCLWHTDPDEVVFSFKEGCKLYLVERIQDS